jgi:hypothetical protein
MNMKEESMEHGERINENRPQTELRHAGMMNTDHMQDIQRGGGSDPRRYQAKILIDTKVRDHDMSGYNHNATPAQHSNGGHENEMYAKEQDVKAVKMGTPNPDGTYKY